MYYNITSDSTVEVTYGYQRSNDNYQGLSSISIPEVVTNVWGTTYSVTSIGERAFMGCSSLTYITIPNNVTSLGNQAFSDCTGLTSITIPNSVTSIGECAFMGCSSLTSITIPNSVMSIKIGAFLGCSSLTSVIWNAKVYSDFERNGTPFYFDDAYYLNLDVRPQITSFVFGDSVQHIPAYLCRGMKNLTSITIPNSVTSIGGSAFEGCEGLTSIIIPNGVTSIEDRTFNGCTSLTSITIPNNVTNIGHSAFEGCKGLTSITIPNSVTNIGYDAFYDCKKLTKTNYTGDIIGWCAILFGNIMANPVTYSHNLYINGEEVRDLEIPNSVMSIGDYAFCCCNLTSITIPNSVTSIGDNAFYSCAGLTSITIGAGVKNIGSSVFKGCNSLNHVVWNSKNYPNLNDGNTPFYYKSYNNNFDLRPQITSFVFGDSVQYIPQYLCAGMNNLTSITIPDGVKDIGCYAFRNCTGLTNVTIGDGVTTIGDNENYYYKPQGAFANCTNLTSITIGKGVKSIGTTTFSGCGSLKSVHYRGTLADWVDIDFDGYEAGSNPLEYADSLLIDNKYVTELTLPNGVTEIKCCAFRGYKGLQQIHIPNTLKTIGLSAFYGCTGIDTLIIGNGVDSIYDQFEGCSGITYLQLGSGVKFIYHGAFFDAQKLKRIVCYAVEPPVAQVQDGWYNGSFYNYNIHVQVPCDNLEAYETDAVWGSFKYLECVGADNVDTDGKVIITPSDNEVEITWPSDGSADTYSLVITQDGKEVCTLIFNSNGQLMRIAFAAPSRNGTTHHAPAAVLTQSGYRFTVTGLNSGTQYAYAIDVKDKAGASLNTYKGTFTTTVDGKSTDVEDVTTDTSLESDAPRKVFHDGQVYILRGGKTFTLTGVEVM